MTLWRSSIRLRLSARYVAGLSLLLLAFGAGVYAVVRARLWRELQARAAAELEGLARVVEQEGVSSPEELDEQVSVPFLLQDAAGATVYVSPAWLDLGLPRSVSVAELAAQREWLRRQPRTVLLAQRRVSAEQRELGVLVALEATEIERSLSALLVALLTGTATALACALGMGYWLAGSALAPAARLARAAERVGADDSKARLPVAGTHDEFDRLALAFNAVLERLQAAIGELGRFSSNASHELRTPLTAMRLVGEQALRRGVDPRAREAISSMLEEVERSTGLVEQLLCLARAEGAEPQQRSTPVDLAAVAREVVGACAVLAEERGLELRCEQDGELPALAHPLLLRQALYNLLDNAIRYTPQGGHVRVRTRRISAREAAVEIVDDGPGIAPADQQRVFERFERVSGAAAAPGAGLGLAIARRAIEICRGRIELSSALGVGSCFRIVLANSAGVAPPVEDPTTAHDTARLES